jgi:hypothetical protein
MLLLMARVIIADQRPGMQMFLPVEDPSHHAACVDISAN